jgi:hypothetical protein
VFGHSFLFGEDGRPVFDGGAKGRDDGGYDVSDCFGGAPAGLYADDVAFDEGGVGVGY